MQTMKLSETANVADEKGAFLFGGKVAGRKAPKRELVTVRAEFLPRGIVKLFNVDSGAEELHSRIGTVVYAGPVQDMPAEPKKAPKKAPKAPRKAVKKAEAPKVEEPAKIPGKAPANFVDLARSANTEAAKRYWKRRVEQYEG